jgi:hypothetical protein
MPFMSRSWKTPTATLSAALIAAFAWMLWAAPDTRPAQTTPSRVEPAPPATVDREAALDRTEPIVRSAVTSEARPTVLAVRVLDHSGTPIRGANVSFASPHAQWMTTSDRRRVGDRSDDQGILELSMAMVDAVRDEAPDPSWCFAVEHADHQPTRLPITPPEVVVVLAPAASIDVECVSDSGEPVAGVVVAFSRFVEFEALRSAVLYALQEDAIPTPGPLAGDRAVLAGVSDADGRIHIGGCAPGRYAWLAGHRTWVPVDASSTASAVDVPGERLRIVFTQLVAACIDPSDPESVLSINTDRTRADFDSGPAARHGGFAATIQLAKSNGPTGLRVAVPAMELRREGRRPELRYSVLFPSGWTHVTVPMIPVSAGFRPVPVAAPDGPDLTGSLVLRVEGMPDTTAIDAELPTIEVLGDGAGGGVFHRATRCGDTLRLPEGDYRLLSANPWIDDRQHVHVSRGQVSDVVLPRTRELRPCRLVLAGPPGAVLPSVDLWIGPPDARDRGLVLRSWIPGLEHEDPDRGALQWLPVGELLIAVKGRGVIKVEHSFFVDQRYAIQILTLPVELSRP